jgi:hypothetical protein
MKYRATAAAWFSSFLLNALVRRVNRRIPIRIERFWRSAKLVLMCSESGLPVMPSFFASQAHGGAVALLAFGVLAVDFNQHRIVDIFTESLVNGSQISLMAVCGQLRAIRETAREIGHKVTGRVGVTATEQPEDMGRARPADALRLLDIADAAANPLCVLRHT